MRINREMERLLIGLQVNCRLNPELEGIAERGFRIVGDCYLIGALFDRDRNVDRSNFQDATGFECFVNSLHIEDYDEKSPLSQAIQFIHSIFGVWSKLPSNLVLVAVVSADELSVVVKFHARREGKRWLSENLEGYIDAMMSTDSREDVVEAIRSVVSPLKRK